jgi:hypothetical protein
MFLNQSMKQLLFLLGAFTVLSCSKSDPTSSSIATTPPVTTNPTPAPVAPVITLKNYLVSSYELQQSDVKIDIMKLRFLQEGINSGWNILAVAFLDINADGNDDIFYTAGYGDTTRTQGKIFIYKNGEYILDNSYFTTPPSLILARKAIVGDYNGDKMPDIFVIFLKRIAFDIYLLKMLHSLQMDQLSHSLYLVVGYTQF